MNALKMSEWDFDAALRAKGVRCHLSSYKNGGQPSVPTLWAMAKVLKVRMDQLIEERRVA